MSRRGDYEFRRGPRELITDPEERRHREAENGLLQLEYLRGLWNTSFDLRLITPPVVCECNRLAVLSLIDNAGDFRDGFVSIDNSSHVPPNYRHVPHLVTEMCDYLHRSSEHEIPDVIHLAAYILWRLNWIHPFWDGNGRTARALMYLTLSLGLKMELPGVKTVADLLVDQRERYYAGLVAADKGWDGETPHVQELETLLAELLIEQLESASSP